MLRATRQVLRRGATTVHKTTSKQPARKEASSPEPVGDMSHEEADRHTWKIATGVILAAGAFILISSSSHPPRQPVAVAVQEPRVFTERERF
ncbi:hypothetical protein DIPPA_02803 [Diplonema papillatum]|nr:hypothetical protein DIPPA_02803 [Diplonema papillatum]